MGVFTKILNLRQSIESLHAIYPIILSDLVHTSPVELVSPVKLIRHDELGFSEILKGSLLQEIEPKLISSVAQSKEALKNVNQPLTLNKETFIWLLCLP